MIPVYLNLQEQKEQLERSYNLYSEFFNLSSDLYVFDIRLNPRNSSNFVDSISFLKKEMLYLMLSDSYNNKRGIALLKFY